MVHRIQHGQVVGAQLQRSVNEAVRIHGRVAPVRRDLVVQVRLRIRPLPFGDDDVPLQPLRTRWLRRDGAGGDAIRPIGEQRQRALLPERV